MGVEILFNAVVAGVCVPPDGETELSRAEHVTFCTSVNFVYVRGGPTVRKRVCGCCAGCSIRLQPRPFPNEGGHSLSGATSADQGPPPVGERGREAKGELSLYSLCPPLSFCQC